MITDKIQHFVNAPNNTVDVDKFTNYFYLHRVTCQDFLQTWRLCETI